MAEKETVQKKAQQSGYAKVKGMSVGRAVMDIDMERADKYLSEGTQQYLKGDKRRAVSSWQKVITLDPDNEMVKEYIKKARQKLK